jgi:hypothetical protein
MFFVIVYHRSLVKGAVKELVPAVTGCCSPQKEYRSANTLLLRSTNALLLQHQLPGSQHPKWNLPTVQRDPSLPVTTMP